MSANTGNNTSSFNTGGDSNIQTGDANIVANIVNFVNNNISGNGKLFVTVVNVFGSWMGDFVTPGQTQRSHNTAGGDNNGSNNNNPSASNNNSGNSNNSSNSNSTAATTTGNGNVNVNVGNSGNTNSTGSTFTAPVMSLFASANKSKTPKAEVLGDKDGKTLTINLAILVFLLPVAGFIWLERKFAFLRNIINKGVHLLL